MMTMLVEEGWIALIAIAIMIVELVLLRLRGWPDFAPFAANALSGICLLAALYFSLTGAGTGAVAGALAASLVAHLASLVLARAGRGR